MQFDSESNDGRQARARARAKAKPKPKPKPKPKHAIGHYKNKGPRDKTSFSDQLCRQIRYIENSVILFDNGDEAEAIRIATTLRVLLHDTQNSVSLLMSLNLKHQMRFADTRLYRDKLNAARNKGAIIAACSYGEAGLIEIRGNPERSYGFFAPLRKERFHPKNPLSQAFLPPQAFEFWWTTPLVENQDGLLFSREQLVCIITNQDGGAHVDPGLDSDCHALYTDHLSMQKRHIHPGEPIPNIYSVITSDESFNVRNNIAFASVRQIAYEVILTLHRHIQSIPQDPDATCPLPMYQPTIHFGPFDGFSVTIRGTPINCTTGTEISEQTSTPRNQTTQPTAPKGQATKDISLEVRPKLAATYAFRTKAKPRK